jgi:hypothetical protein
MSHWRGGAGQAHRRWKMCDGWPAGPARSRIYTTPIKAYPTLSPRCPGLVSLIPPLRDDACGAVRERARATNPLHGAGIDPKPFRDVAHAWPSRSRQSPSDPLFQLGASRPSSVGMTARLSLRSAHALCDAQLSCVHRRLALLPRFGAVHPSD